MTLLVVSIAGRSIEEVRRRLEAAIQRGADLIELRVDLMEGVSDEEIRGLGEHLGRPIIVTIRSAAEGGHWDGLDDALVSRLIELGPMTDYIDVELELWQRSANARQKIGLALRRTEATQQVVGSEAQTAGTQPRAAGPRGERELILSRHDVRGRPARLHTEFLAMVRDPFCRIPKLAWQARSIRDNFEAFELMRASPKPAIIICLGEAGLLSRVLARKFGAFATFAAAEPGGETASGQLTITEMKELYRWDAINDETRVYGIVGNPVAHSLSPRLHNAAFAALGENAVYLPMKVESSYESLKAFLAEVLARPWLDFRGFSVTMPHKEHALRFLRETGGKVDPLAERIGAVNTLIVESDGCLSGCNTDGSAAIAALEQDLAAMRVAVLGAGGAARAVVAGLTDAGATVTIYNRTEERAAALAEALGCRHLPWDARGQTDADLLVNCTSVGLSPAEEASPFPAEALSPRMTVFDTVYNPVRTRLLRDAAERGCRTIDGLSMFVRQARTQLKLWTGRELAAETLRQTVEPHAMGAP
jgi:3-dehydroquinate dehydratase/shikimate dehydrogenase